MFYYYKLYLKIFLLTTPDKGTGTCLIHQVRSYTIYSDFYFIIPPALIAPEQSAIIIHLLKDYFNN